MPENTPKPKERLALLRFETIGHIKTLHQEGLPLSECLRAASLRPWSDSGGPDGAATIGLALPMPEQPRYMRAKLLDTDGCRDCYHPQTGKGIS